MIVPDRLLPYLAVDSPAHTLALRLEAAGHECFLVGGTVRDALLDRTNSDLDLTTSARPDVIADTVKGWADSVWLPGQRFGTVSCEKNGARMEITTYRGDIYRPESRKPEVTFADTIEEDLVRRDFTVNAMALAILEPRLVDPCAGVDDLVNRRLRTPRSPEESFADDPLRMLRAARFVASLGFEPDADMVAAMRTMHHRLEIVSAERVRDELERLLVVEDPSLGLWLLCETGLSDEFLPELNAM
ncbi:MAG: CCA tRNA nucleotidyltransferase, partial [Actinobacteria bacterium]|nr:CCA tRNA nucleotidyltransferase [Actinomycetota bacterium]